MNLIADAMEPYLAADGIEYLRNAPEMTLGQAIADSNNSNVDFHLAIHSNAAPPPVAGTRRGPVVYYYATSPYGRQMAELGAKLVYLPYTKDTSSTMLREKLTEY